MSMSVPVCRWVIFLLLFLSTLRAESILTVNPDPNAGADFTELQQAIDAANANDIIHVAGSAHSRIPNIRIDKPLSIYGPGFFLVENEAKTGTNMFPAGIHSLQIESGGDGTLISGMILHSSISIFDVTSVYLRGNLIQGELYCQNVGLAVIAQNYFSHSWGGDQLDFRDCATVRFRNNIVAAGKEFDCSGYDGATLLFFHHNLFEGRFSLHDVTADIRYNIFYNTNFDPGFFSLKSLYNVGIGSNPLPFFDVNNLSDVSYNDVFGIAPNEHSNSLTVDADFGLPTGSVARDVLDTGIDAGPYGGTEPYRLSGLPNIPRITSLVAPDFATTSGGLTIELTVESGPEAP